MPVKRGVADAALRLHAEYPLLKYDTGVLSASGSLTSSS
jgi:hypothetical protein